MFSEILSVKVNKQSKEEKRLLRKIRKMKAGDEMKLHGYDMICYDDLFYLLISPTGIYEKHYNELKDWVIQGGELD